jgi:hypothetical protein
MTPTQLSRLAAWAKITPETHAHLAYVNKKKKDTPPYDLEFTGVGLRLPDPTDPGADPREVDRVWLADLVWTLSNEDFQPEISGDTVWFQASVYLMKKVEESSMTMALLRAARAAGVPEVVECMGDNSNG